jgi:hypothetical protein
MKSLNKIIKTRWQDGYDTLGYRMPNLKTPAWKRLPAIRHIRAVLLLIKVARHRQMMADLGFIPNDYDSFIIDGIWLGRER